MGREIITRYHHHNFIRFVICNLQFAICSSISGTVMGLVFSILRIRSITMISIHISITILIVIIIGFYVILNIAFFYTTLNTIEKICKCESLIN